jgi:predicted signal transduction protein with EAL and GGDEF domain
VFDGDEFDIFRAGAEDDATAALFAKSTQQGKSATTETRKLLDGASAAGSSLSACFACCSRALLFVSFPHFRSSFWTEKEAAKQHAKLAIARQEEEAEQRQILEKLNKAAAEQEALAKASKQSLVHRRNLSLLVTHGPVLIDCLC